ncbi:GAF domain-containing protein [filamentous cyanobacterium LEGE 11480]|uniref:histidine kinase n=1 Tax=Romeriopsis navalis LEGE 11480 TaxID=2777977 RepID=A0A928VK61_9CYAN|nr:GAF domain-containing protein [Romeriopsis navalis]MBE9029835.1 GAF domain-containing protein [Romeriopsis navalis LEGE 11480]
MFKHAPNPQVNTLQQTAYQLSACADQLFQQIEQQQTLTSIVDRIRASVALDDIFKTTAVELRQLLNADRVGVFRFTREGDWNDGRFVAEDVRSDIPSALTESAGKQFANTQFADYYTQGQVQVVADIYNSGLSNSQVQMLEQFQVRANLIVPVLKGDVVWGLLCIHQCSHARRWQPSEIEFVRKIADHFAIALKQAEYFDQLQDRAMLQAQAQVQAQALKRQKALTKITNRIRRSLDWEVICETATTEVRQMLDVDRVTIYRFNPDWSGDFLFESLAEGWQPLVGVSPTIVDTHLASTQGGRYANNETFAVDDIHAAGLDACHIALLEQFEAKSYAIAPIFQGERLWGLLAAFQNSGPRQWQPDEVELLAQTGEQLGIALRQANIQAKKLHRQKALTKITHRIRHSLELDVICSTATAEVRQLLETDRVAVFQFNADWSGDFRFESVADGWKPLVGVMPTITDTHLTTSQGGRYANNETFAVDDIYAAGLDDCHVALLEEFQAKAYAIVPIFHGDRLWGLLATFQNTGPRPWQADEVELLAQIGEQLGIALQQADEQAQKLNRQKALTKITNQIRQSLDWDMICDTATTQVRQMLEADRVAIYRFNPDWSGDFLFESVAEGWNPLVGVMPTITDTYLMESQGGRYAHNETFAVADIYAAELDNCHVALLEEFQAKAYAIAAIFQGDQLWGLLAAFQNSGPRSWQADEVELLAQTGEQLGIALRQSESMRQIQAQSIERQHMLEELQQSQMQLIQNEKMAGLGQLVAGVAHEINNPVNFIHGNLTHVNEYVHDLLALTRCSLGDTPDSSADLEAYQEQIEAIDLDFILEDLPKILKSMKLGTDRIRQIVLSLRNFSRLDESLLKEVDIHEGIESTLLILGHRMKVGNDNTRVEVIKEYGEIPLVACCPSQLNQVFMNLLANAIDAISEAMQAGKLNSVERDDIEAPKIWIKTQVNEQNQLEIRIRNNGFTIPAENQSKVFDHFFTTKAVGEGTGLGLAISQQIIVEHHQGTIAVNPNVENGVEFVIGLPIDLEEESAD